jgi:hypothetical protein
MANGSITAYFDRTNFLSPNNGKLRFDFPTPRTSQVRFLIAGNLNNTSPIVSNIIDVDLTCYEAYQPYDCVPGGERLFCPKGWAALNSAQRGGVITGSCIGGLLLLAAFIWYVRREYLISKQDARQRQAAAVAWQPRREETDVGAEGELELPVYSERSGEGDMALPVYKENPDDDDGGAASSSDHERRLTEPGAGHQQV